MRAASRVGNAMKRFAWGIELLIVLCYPPNPKPLTLMKKERCINHEKRLHYNYVMYNN